MCALCVYVCMRALCVCMLCVYVCAVCMCNIHVLCVYIIMSAVCVCLHACHCLGCLEILTHMQQI